MALALVVGLLVFFFTILQCSPVDFFRSRLTETGSCIDVDVLIAIAYVYSAGAAVTDLTIVLLPVFLLWNLQANRRTTKFAIVGILSIGCMLVVRSPQHIELALTRHQRECRCIIRAPYVENYKDHQFLCKCWSSLVRCVHLTLGDATTDISIWSNIEACLGITAGCLTTMRPFCRALRDTTSSSRSRPRETETVPLSGNLGSGIDYARSKAFDRNESRQLWASTTTTASWAARA